MAAARACVSDPHHTQCETHKCVFHKQVCVSQTHNSKSINVRQHKKYKLNSYHYKPIRKLELKLLSTAHSTSDGQQEIQPTNTFWIKRKVMKKECIPRSKRDMPIYFCMHVYCTSIAPNCVTHRQTKCHLLESLMQSMCSRLHTAKEDRMNDHLVSKPIASNQLISALKTQCLQVTCAKRMTSKKNILNNSNRWQIYII